MITKTITFCGQKATHACDGRCDKAWGHNSRPTVPARKGPDDINKWRVRECERAWISPPGHPDAPPVMPDFSVRLYNIAPHRRDA